MSVSCAVNSDIAAADDNYAAVECILAVLEAVAQILNSDMCAGCVVVLDSGASAALTADGNIERLVALLFKLSYRDILADLNAALDIGAELFDDIDLCGDNILFKLVAGDAVGEHTAGDRVLFENGGLVTHLCEIVCRTQTGRTAADDGNLLVERAVGRLNGLFGHESVLSVEVEIGDELLDRVYRNGSVNLATGALGFASLVADASADSRERVLGFYHRESLAVLALVGEAQISLNGHVRGTCRLARSGAAGICVGHTRGVAVVLIPCIGSPDVVVRQGSMRIFDLGAVLAAELLTHLDGARRAGLNALAAGYALLLLDLCGVGAARKIGRIEQQRSTQSVADFDVAVADVENLVLAVDVGYLMNIAVLLGKFEYLESALFGYVVRASGLDSVVRHVAELDAPIVKIIGAAVAEHCARSAAGADTCGDVTLVFLEPI